MASLGEDTGRNLISTAATIRSIGLQVEAFSLENAHSWVFAHYFVSWLAAAVETQPILRDPLIRALIESDDGDASFLEKILSADHWLTKGLRKDFNRILVKCALSDAATKQRVGLIYGSCFPSMLDLYLEGDREPEHSLVHFSVQLFTVSSVITSLVMETRFYEEICSIAQAYFQASPNRVDQLPKNMISDTTMLLTVLRYVFKDPSVKKAGFYFDPINFMHFADAFIEPLEGINPQSREIDTHVLFESRKWTTSFTLQIQVCDVLFLYVDLMDELDTVEKVLELLIKEYKPFSEEPSLHSLLVTCVSFLVKKVFQLSESQSKAIEIVGALVREFSFTDFLKTSIKMIQFSSEIEAGLWVRNGLSMSSQLHLFRYSPYRFYFWDAAICCLKAFLLCASFDEFVNLIMSCWPQKIAEDSLITPVLFEFSRFLMSVIYGVSFSWITDEKLVAEALDAVLFSGPYSFSDLEQLLPEHWISLDCFSAHLSEYSREKLGDELGNHVFDMDPSQFRRFCPFYFLYSPEIRERALERLSTESSASDLFVLSFLGSSPLSMDEFTLVSSKPLPQLIAKLTHQLLGSSVKSHLSLGLALSCLLFPRADLIPFIAGFFKGLSEISRKFIRSQLDQVVGVSASHLDLILFESSPSPKDLASSDAKRRALERISKARKGFLETSVTLDESDSIDASDTDLSASNSPYSGLKSSCCVICQAPVDSKTPVGILGFLRRSHISGCSFLFSSCLHIIHLDCFKVSLAKAKIACCPLCSSVSNFYLAVENMKPAEFGSFSPHLSAQPLEDLANWIKSGQLDLSCRRNFKNEFTARATENYQYSFDSFMAALRAQGLKTDFSAAKLVQDLIVRLKSLGRRTVEFADNLESLRNLFKLVRIWIALDVCSKLSAEVQGLADIFCGQGMLQKDIYIPATLTCLLSNSGEDLSYSEKGLRLCQLVYCLSLRHLVLGGFMSKEIEKSEEIVFSLLEDLHSSLLIWYNLPSISGQSSLEMTRILGLPLLTSSLVEELLLDTKDVFGHFSARLTISPPAIIKFITLEERYDKLLLQYSLKYCAVCNQRPLSPALCLLCGTLLCANSSCCFDGDHGECNSHVLRYFDESYSSRIYLYIDVDEMVGYFYFSAKILSCCWDHLSSDGENFLIAHIWMRTGKLIQD